MKKIQTTLLLLCFGAFTAFAQQTIVYYNDEGKKVDSKEEATTAEHIEKTPEGYYYVKVYFDDTLSSEGAFSQYGVEKKENIREGLHKHYQRMGNFMYYTEEYVGGKLHGELRNYYPSGKLKRIERYNQNEFLSGECFNEDGSPKPFTRFQQVPGYPGGESAMMAYLSENMKYPKKARKKGIEGQVVVTFVVDKEGKVTDVRILRDPGGGCGEEAARLVREMPRWTPGMANDRPVKVRYTLPMRFRLD